MSNLLNIIRALLNEEEDDPMKTTPASIKKAGGDPKVYKREKAKKAPKKVVAKKPTKRARQRSLEKGGGKFRRERIQPPKGHQGPSAPTKQNPVTDYAEGGKEHFKKKRKGGPVRALPKKQVDRMGVRGQEKKIAAHKKKMARKTRRANMQAMIDMGVLKVDKDGKVTRAKR